MNGIFKNSYVVLFICFTMLCVIFYTFEIGYSIKVENNKVVREFSWKYPLGISLIIWIFWHFYVYPPPEELEYDAGGLFQSHESVSKQLRSEVMRDGPIPRIQHDSFQKINMINWT